MNPMMELMHVQPSGSLPGQPTEIKVPDRGASNPTPHELNHT